MRPIFNQISSLVEIRRLWLYLYLFKATLSALLALPFFVTCDLALSRSLFSKSLLGGWDVSVLTELYSRQSAALSPLIMIIIAGAVMFVIMMQFLNGGLYYILVSRKFTQAGWRDFFSECGARFGTHVKITLLMMVVYSLLIPAGMFFVNVISFAGGHLVGTPALIFSLFKLAILLLILLAASIFSDSVRAASTAFPDKGFREILKIGSDYFKPRLLKLLRVFIITYIPFLLIWLLVEWLALQSVGDLGGTSGLFIEFVLFQIAALSRTGQKLWYLLFLGRDFRSVNPGRFVPEQVEMSLES
ncbi:MAG: hypothetical protein JSU69_10040 [Candidatus Zixiibacteriota bacterium]|nr:MAG: hypothetical protein JSU69_10040 [candidate division Zixibacteria bacterium]